MKFFQKHPHVSLNPTEFSSQNTANHSEELIQNSIAETVLQVSSLSRDINDEINVVMMYCGNPDRIDIDSMEFVIALHFIGSLKGVVLEAHDIEEIIGNLKYYALLTVIPSDPIDEPCDTTEVNQ